MRVWSPLKIPHNFFYCLKNTLSKSSFILLLVRIVGVCVCVPFAEIEMVVMDKSKASELTEQNITDEEKSAAATRTNAQQSRWAEPSVGFWSSALEKWTFPITCSPSSASQALSRHGVQRARLHSRWLPRPVRPLPAICRLTQQRSATGDRCVWFLQLNSCVTLLILLSVGLNKKC